MRRVAVIPGIDLRVAGASLPEEVARTLSGIRVQHRLSRPSLCELTFRDPPSTWPRLSDVAPGDALGVAVEGHGQELFGGDVTAVEHLHDASRGREVRLRAFDRLHRLRKSQAARAHAEMTVESLAAELAGPAGLSVEASGPGPLWRVLIQHRQSDLELLAGVAERCGMYLTVRGSVLHLVTLEGMGDPVALALGDSLLDVRLEVNGDPACREVEATGWDPARVEVHTALVTTSRVGRAVLAEAPPERLGSTGRRELVGYSAHDDTHAEGIAQAELDRRSAREVTVSGTAEGNSALCAGARVDISGVAAELEGRYVLTEVNHTIDDRLGFVSEFSSRPPEPPVDRETGSVAAYGVVSSIDDPDRMGRVRVSVPVLGDVESDWMGVASAGAGAGKGLTSLPDVGDRVLVIFPQDDLGRGIVLGGLHGVDGPPDYGIEEGKVRRHTILTPGGQLVRFDDSLGLVRLENATGSHVELGRERVLIRAVGDLAIEAPGRTVTIGADAINFERLAE